MRSVLCERAERTAGLFSHHELGVPLLPFLTALADALFVNAMRGGCAASLHAFIVDGEITALVSRDDSFGSRSIRVVDHDG